MAKPNPFAGKKAPPFGGGKGRSAFEGSKADVEKYPEGSKKDMAMDKKQMAFGGFKRGGGVKRGK